jgi:hypothetical protein
MSSHLPTTLPAAILETILLRLALLFLAGADNDPVQARQAAAQMLASYYPEIEDIGWRPLSPDRAGRSKRPPQSPA